MPFEESPYDINITRPKSILHVVGAMRVGGIETWLVQVLRRLDRERFQVDILTHTTEECFYDKEVQALGARLLPASIPPAPGPTPAISCGF